MEDEGCSAESRRICRCLGHSKWSRRVFFFGGTRYRPKTGPGRWPPPLAGLPDVGGEDAVQVLQPPSTSKGPGRFVVATVTLLWSSHWPRTDTASLQGGTEGGGLFWGPHQEPRVWVQEPEPP